MSIEQVQAEPFITRKILPSIRRVFAAVWAWLKSTARSPERSLKLLMGISGTLFLSRLLLWFNETEFEWELLLDPDRGANKVLWTVMGLAQLALALPWFARGKRLAAATIPVAIGALLILHEDRFASFTPSLEYYGSSFLEFRFLYLVSLVLALACFRGALNGPTKHRPYLRGLVIVAAIVAVGSWVVPQKVYDLTFGPPTGDYIRDHQVAHNGYYEDRELRWKTAFGSPVMNLPSMLRFQRHFSDFRNGFGASFDWNRGLPLPPSVPKGFHRRTKIRMGFWEVEKQASRFVLLLRVAVLPVFLILGVLALVGRTLGRKLLSGSKLALWSVTLLPPLVSLTLFFSAAAAGLPEWKLHKDYLVAPATLSVFMMFLMADLAGRLFTGSNPSVTQTTQPPTNRR